MEWFSWIIAIVVGLSAVISPIIVVIINNKHSLKLSKLNMFNEARRTSLNEFIESTEEVIISHMETDLCSYFSSLDKLFIYFDNIYLDMFSNLNDLLKNHNDSLANRELANIVQVLSKQIEKQ